MISIKRTFQNNNCSTNIILDSVNSNKRIDEEYRKTVTVCLHYVKGLSEKVKICGLYKIRTVYRSSSNLRKKMLPCNCRKCNPSLAVVVKNINAKLSAP